MAGTEMVKVIVDQRERNTELIAQLESEGVELDFRTMPVGDYAVSDRVCIERKTVSDFESSIINGRLFDQLERLKKGYELPIVVIEGDRAQFRLGGKVIGGTIVSIAIDYGIPVVMSDGPEHTAEIVAGIAKREQADGKREISLKGAARARTSEQFMEYVVGNLPGVGPKLSRALLGHFGSIAGIANASIEEIMGVDMVGKKKATEIHRTMHGKYA